MKVQRIRVTFSRGEEMKYITHLDVMRFWERALRRAEVPIAYSEGFSPHAQIALAAPLAVGTTSDAELMDVFMAERMTPRALIGAVAAQLPAGVAIRSAQEVGMALPALQAAVRWAEYLVDVGDGNRDAESETTGVATDNRQQTRNTVENRPPPIEDVRAAIDRFLAAESIPWEHKREDEVRSYDIRAMVAELELIAADDDRESESLRMRMRLKNDSSGSGRPEQVVAALGLPPPARIHRTKLILAETSPSREAWRKRGRFAG